MQVDPIDDGSHRMLPDPKAQVPPLGVLGREVLRTLDQRVVRWREVTRPANETGQGGCDILDHGSGDTPCCNRSLENGNVDDQIRRLVEGRPSLLQFGVCGKGRHPACLPGAMCGSAALHPGFEPAVHVFGYYERWEIPAVGLPDQLDLVDTKRV